MPTRRGTVTRRNHTTSTNCCRRSHFIQLWKGILVSILLVYSYLLSVQLSYVKQEHPLLNPQVPSKHHHQQQKMPVLQTSSSSSSSSTTTGRDHNDGLDTDNHQSTASISIQQDIKLVHKKDSGHKPPHTPMETPSCLLNSINTNQDKDKEDDNTPHCAFDEIGKYLEDSAKFTIIHPLNDAIPIHRKIPSSMSKNHTYIDNRRNSGPDDGSQTALVSFNPSILPLNSDLDKDLLDYLTGRYHPDFTDEEADQVKYLSIARTSNGPHACGGVMPRFGYNPREHSYLSLTLLDDYLQPIPNASAIVLAYQAMLPECYHRKKMKLSPFHDYQVIAVRSTKGNPKKDQLFMTASDVNTKIFPIDIRRVPAPTNSAEGWQTKMTNDPVPMIPQDPSSHLFYGRGLQVRFMKNVKPQNETDCELILNYNAIDRMKNYHFFDIPNPKGGEDSLNYVELRPHWTRNLRPVNFYAQKFEKYGDWELIPGGTFQSIHNSGARNRDDVILNQFKIGEPKQQFLPPKNLELKTMNGRGTSCCVDLDFGKNHTFKVGISHTLTGVERGYLSRFYAFSAKPPRFLNVAISGPFCLGGLDKQKDINAEMQVFPAPDLEKNRLHLPNVTFDCPHITFASGLTEYQADKNFVVISYGVNDCYSRSVVVSKKRIIELLDIKGTEGWRDWDWD